MLLLKCKVSLSNVMIASVGAGDIALRHPILTSPLHSGDLSPPWSEPPLGAGVPALFFPSSRAQGLLPQFLQPHQHSKVWIPPQSVIVVQREEIQMEIQGHRFHAILV